MTFRILVLLFLLLVGQAAHAADACQGTTHAEAVAAALAAAERTMATYDYGTNARTIDFDTGVVQGLFDWSNNGGASYLTTSAGLYTWSCPDVASPPANTCTAGEFKAGAWPTDGSGTACRGSCETTATIQIGGSNPTFGTVTTGNQCPANSPPPAEAPSTPHSGYTPDDPNDPSKGGKYCTSDPTVCVHGPAPDTGGSGSNPPSSSTSATPPDGGTGGSNPPSSSSTGGTGGTGTGGTGTGGTGTGGTGTGGDGTGGTGTNPAGSSSTGGKCTAGDACTSGNAAGVPGQLYKPDGTTLASVFSDFAGKVKETPLASAITGYFDVGSISGSCPIWTLPESEWLPAMTFDFFCNPTALEILGWAGWVVLCIGAYRAFSIAIY